MSEGALFLIGIVIVAVTIYGAVVGGMAITRVVLDHGPQRSPEVSDGQHERVLSTSGP